MQKRNIIILIVAVVLIVLLGFLFLSLGKPAGQTTTEPGTNFFADFLSFGGLIKSPTSETPPANISGFEPPVLTEEQKGRLRKISDLPVAGFVAFNKERSKTAPAPVATTEIPTSGDDATSETPKTPPVAPSPTTELAPAVRFVEKTTGNVYQTFLDKIFEQKLSGTIIPRVHDAYFTNNGEVVAMRYLQINTKKIETFFGPLVKQLPSGELMGAAEINGSFLPEGILDISSAPDFSRIFYLFKVGDGVAGVTANLANNTKTQVFESSFTEWLSQWPNQRMITLTTKPSYLAEGYMYAVDPERKDFNKILGGMLGLTTSMSPSGKAILYSNNSLNLSFYDLIGGDTTTLSIKTLPEKCVWTRNSLKIYCFAPRSSGEATYPDIWYQGEISFSDMIWEIDAINKTANIIIDPVSVEGVGDIDGIKLMLNEAEDALFFINKKDSTLWVLDLK